MSKFKVGDVLTCINKYCPDSVLVVGRRYIITHVIKRDFDEEVVLMLDNTPYLHKTKWFTKTTIKPFNKQDWL